MTQAKQPWIYSPAVDGFWILGVPFMVVAVVFLLPPAYLQADTMTVVSWVILVLGVDVSHVYATIYRTYADSDMRRDHPLFLYLVPFAVFLGLLLLYSFGAMVFWRVLAYYAVFHFIRQQYGFVRVYSRYENQTRFERAIDTTTIYTAALYPIVNWHLSGPKNFNWFMKGDFIYHVSSDLKSVALALYVVITTFYVSKELLQLRKSIAMRRKKGEKSQPLVNIPRNTLIAGTALSWYVGILYFNSDLAFTAINVVSHGIPYIALVWIYGRKKYVREGFASTFIAKFFRLRYVAFYAGLLFVFAYFEEGFWNILVWHEGGHASFFRSFYLLGELAAKSPWLAFFVPLLSVPQVTHYVFDAFIWKIKKDKYAWRDITLAKPLGAARTLTSTGNI